MANSCQVLKRCIGDGRSGEGDSSPGRACRPRSVRSMPSTIDRVHAEGEGAVEARVGAVLRAARRRRRGRRRRVAGSTSGIGQRAHGLTSFSRTGPSAAAKTISSRWSSPWASRPPRTRLGRKRASVTGACAGAARGGGSPRRATRSTRRAAESRPGTRRRRRSSPVQRAVGEARRLGIEARQAERPAEEVAEPLRAERRPCRRRRRGRPRPRPRCGSSTRSTATCSASMPGARRISSSP